MVCMNCKNKKNKYYYLREIIEILSKKTISDLSRNILDYIIPLEHKIYWYTKQQDILSYEVCTHCFQSGILWCLDMEERLPMLRIDRLYFIKKESYPYTKWMYDLSPVYIINYYRKNEKVLEEGNYENCWS